MNAPAAPAMASGHVSEQQSHGIPSSCRLRVLAAVIVPPHLTASGGARAAAQLSDALAPYCAIDLASMMPAPNDTPPHSAPHDAARRLPVRTWLPGPLPWQRLPTRHRTLFYRSDLPERIAAGGYDLVHIHNPMPALEMARVSAACRRAGTPYVVSTHGFNEVANGEAIYGFDWARRQVWQQLVVRPVAKVVRHAAAVFALSPADLPILRAMGFGGPNVIVPNGIDLPPPPDPTVQAATLARLGIPATTPGVPMFFFLANHTPNKGLPVLLDAMARLDRPFLLVIGGERRASVDYAAAAATRPGQRILVTGRLADAEVQALFQRADAFVFPTLADTFPLAVLEAMAQRLPVIASRVGGIPHQIDDSCGVLVPPGDAAALASAIDALAADPARMATLGRAAQTRVGARFTWPRAAERALAGYQAALR